MAELVRLRAMLDSTLVAQVAAFDARAGAHDDGQTSTLAWLRSRLRLGATAGDLLRVARRLDELPALGKALATGEITLEHAAAVATLAGQVDTSALRDYETVLLDLARQAPPAQLRTACEHLRQLLNPPAHARTQHHHRYLTAARTIGGMVHLQGLLDPASGEIVLTALQAAMPMPAQYEPRTPTQRRADALVDICAGWLATGKTPTSGGIPPQMQVTVSLDTLQSTAFPPNPLRTKPARSNPRSVPSPDEPATRRQTPLLGRALNLRDGGCRFAGCDRPTSWCDAHHIRPWADGGPTKLDNLLLLCAFHHTLIHEGWKLHGHPATTIHFQRPDGTHLDLTSTPRNQPLTYGP